MSDHPEALDTRPRRRAVLDPSATRIGYAADPDDDSDERLRALHAERRADLRDNEQRFRRLDATRVAQAVCKKPGLQTIRRGCVRRTVEPVWILGGIAVSLAAPVLAAVVLAWAVLEFVTPAKLWGKM